MGTNKKLSRDGKAAVIPQEDGSTLHVQDTPRGLRATRSVGGQSSPVDPAAYGITGISSGEVGGGNPRVTLIEAGGTATDLTKRDKGSVSEVEHQAGTSLPKR